MEEKAVPEAPQAERKPAVLFSVRQWLVLLALVFFTGSLTLNLSLLLSARFSRNELRKGFETGYIRLVDDQGRKCGSLMAGDGGGLVLEHPGGKSHLVLSVHGGTPSLVLFDDEGKPRAALAIHEDGEPRLKFADEEEKTTWSAP